MENKQETKQTTFEILNKINLNDRAKEKMGLKYVSWAYAWGELKKAFPDATYHIYSRTEKSVQTIVEKDGDNVTTTQKETENEVLYFTDGHTCHVKVGVTINGIEYIEYLPVMDNRNNSISTALVTSTAVNKAIQRAFVKACARHGLGLYIYAGEDLPEDEQKVFNFKDIEKEANSIPEIAATEDELNKVRQKVIDGINFIYNKSDNGIKNAMTNYIKKLLPNTRISATTITDFHSLRKIDHFISTVIEIING